MGPQPHRCPSCGSTVVRTPRSSVCVHCFALDCANGGSLTIGSLGHLISTGEALCGSLKPGMVAEQNLKDILQAANNMAKVDLNVLDKERSKIICRKVDKLRDILVRIGSILLSELTAEDCEMLLREYVVDGSALRRLVLALAHEWGSKASTLLPWLRRLSLPPSPLLNDCLAGQMDEYLLELLDVIIDVHSEESGGADSLWFVDFDLSLRLVDALPSVKDSDGIPGALLLLARLSREDYSLTRLLTTPEGCVAPPADIDNFRNRLSTGLTSILASETTTKECIIGSLECASTLLTPQEHRPADYRAHHRPCEWAAELLSSSNDPDVVAAAGACVLSFLRADPVLATSLKGCICPAALVRLAKETSQCPSILATLAEVVLLTCEQQPHCLPDMVRAGVALARVGDLTKSHRILQMAANYSSCLRPGQSTELLNAVTDSLRSGIIDISILIPCLEAAIVLQPPLSPEEGARMVHSLLDASAKSRSVSEGVAVCSKLADQLHEDTELPGIRELFMGSSELRLAILSVDGAGKLARSVLDGTLPTPLLHSPTSVKGLSCPPTAIQWQLALTMSPQLDRTRAVCLLAWLFFEVYECGGDVELPLTATAYLNACDVDFNLGLLLAALHASIKHSASRASLIDARSMASPSWEVEDCTLHAPEVIATIISFLSADVETAGPLACRRLLAVLSALVSKRPQLGRDHRIVEVASQCLNRAGQSLEEDRLLAHAMRQLVAAVPTASLDLCVQGPFIIKALSSVGLSSLPFDVTVCEDLLFLLSHCLEGSRSDTAQSRIMASMLRSCVHDLARFLCSANDEVLSPAAPLLLRVCTQASLHSRAEPDPYVMALAERSESGVYGVSYLLSVSALPSASAFSFVPPTVGVERAQWFLQWARLLLAVNSASRVDSDLIQSLLVPVCETVVVAIEQVPCPVAVLVSATALWVTLRSFSERALDSLSQEAALSAIASRGDCSQVALLVLILSIVVDPPMWFDLPSFVHQLVQPLINQISSVGSTMALARRILRELLHLELLPVGAVPVVMRLLGKFEGVEGVSDGTNTGDDWASTTCIVLANRICSALVEGES
ncbi:hypothetical protein FOZ62_007592 [Perkinsus olseni]|uniref:Uncharacterized protein n=1 Tax=Perkinsus olseni TaxID=32597 RepID=A0A7J6Q1N9_PEROL|nr:hypothetical protein FOZ62_007592 [Perkinsus olseni]